MSMTLKQQHVQWGFALVLAAMLAGTAAAQNEGRGNYEDLPEFKASGTIIGLALNQGRLQVEVSETESWLVQVLPGGRGGKFTGSAEPDWLMPGMWVNFTTRFNKKGQPIEPIKLLMVFTPGSNRGREEGQLQPGVKPLTNAGAEISFSGEEKVKPKDDTVLCEVTGQIQAVGKSGIVVLAGMVQVQLPLADEATISVDVSDLRPARIGDKVEVNGRQVAPGQGIGFRVEVKGSTPLGSKSALAETKTKLPTKETKVPTTSVATGKLPAAGERKLPLLGKKPVAVEKPVEVEKAENEE